MRRDLCIIVQVGFAFFTIFSAFNSQGFLEISILRSLAEKQPSTGITENSGYYSLSIIYFVFTFSNLLVPPIIRKIGSKWSQVAGACCYTVFLLSFLHLNSFLLYLSSAILGFGAALLWTGNGVYLVEQSREGKLARNSGILWAMLQSSLVAGALFLYFVLSHSDLVSSYRMVYSVFTATSIVGIVTLALLPTHPAEIGYTPVINDTISQRPLEEAIDEGVEDLEPEHDHTLAIPNRSIMEELENTFNMMKTKEMGALAVCFLFSGVETTFYTGVYSACLSATTKLNHGSDTIIPYNAFCMGAGQIIGGLSFGLGSGSKKFNRSQIIILGTVLHVLAFFLCFLNIPMEAPLNKTTSIAYIQPSMTIALFTGFLLGLADSCWNTQIYTLLGELYKNESPSAFALFKFFQSFASCVSFYYGSMLLLHWQLIILWLGAASAAVSFFYVQSCCELQVIEIM